MVSNLLSISSVNVRGETRKKRKKMMPSMMSSIMSGYALLWVVPGVLFCLAFLTAFIWLFTRRLKCRSSLPLQRASQPHNEYCSYEQGYQLEQRTPEIYQEGGRCYSYPQNEQPQAQYQEMEQVQHQA
jgi:hypothetical protein